MLWLWHGYFSVENMKLFFRQFSGFLVAGGAATAFNFAIFAFLLWLGCGHLVASAIGYVTGIAISFAINRRFVFQARTGRVSQLLRYIATYLLALLMQLGLLSLGVQAGGDPLVVNAIALLIVVSVTYFAVRFMVFRAPPAGDFAEPVASNPSHSPKPQADRGDQ